MKEQGIETGRKESSSAVGVGLSLTWIQPESLHLCLTKLDADEVSAGGHGSAESRLGAQQLYTTAGFLCFSESGILTRRLSI